MINKYLNAEKTIYNGMDVTPVYTFELETYNKETNTTTTYEISVKDMKIETVAPGGEKVNFEASVISDLEDKATKLVDSELDPFDLPF